MSKSSSSSSGGVGCTTLFTAIFVVLKLVGVIDWSWWWVFSPVWISIILAIFAVLFIFFVSKK